MKLQKQLSRKSEKIVYSKYVIVIPPEKIKKVGWREGLDLEAEVKNNKIILKPRKNV